MLELFIRKVYGGMDTANEIEAGMWREVLRIINAATVEGLASATTPPPTREQWFYHELRHGNEVFAAFKVHAMGQEMAAKLLDADGRLKPFAQWRREVEGIASHQMGSWLRTEYDTAVIRAHQAADWMEFERNKDIFPNLRWMPTTSPEPETTHAAYWQAKLTLPVDDPFWMEHHPGDRWNCKCSLESTDEPVNRPADLVPVKPQRGLDNNPGKDGHIFNDTHPYYPKSCGQCFAYKKGGFKNRLSALFVNREKDCNGNCPFIDRCIESTKITGYDKNKWEHSYVSSNGRGYVVTEKERIAEAYVSKNEEKKFEKEMRMCKVAADNGHRIEYLQGVNRPKGETYDITFDGIPTELKSTNSVGNIVQHIGKAVNKQGAHAVLLEFESHDQLIYDRLNEAKRKYNVRLFFYFKGDNKIREL